MRFPALLALPVLVATAAADWRLDLLEEEGIGTRPEDLEKLATRGDPAPAELSRALRELGAEDFPTRERAQQRILAGGEPALKWLRAQPLPDDPEVRLRVAAIRNTLEFPSIGNRDRMLSLAVESLLGGRAAPGSPDTGGVFYEWFGTPAGKLDDGYRGCSFRADAGMGGQVTDGRLVLAGTRPGDGDQSLVLHAGDWPGRDTLPDRFRVSAKLGGTPGGAGAWHLGIHIGKVRALYHPGFDGGGFRFERIGTGQGLTTNRDIGFTPSTRELQRMVIRVHRGADQRVTLAVRIDQDGCRPFETEFVAAADVIGPLDRVGLDRSGRTGGDARFDDFAVELGGR